MALENWGLLVAYHILEGREGGNGEGSVRAMRWGCKKEACNLDQFLLEGGWYPTAQGYYSCKALAVRIGGCKC